MALERSPVHSYGPAAGMPELVLALQNKVASENRLEGVSLGFAFMCWVWMLTEWI